MTPAATLGYQSGGSALWSRAAVTESASLDEARQMVNANQSVCDIDIVLGHADHFDAEALATGCTQRFPSSALSRLR